MPPVYRGISDCVYIDIRSDGNVRRVSARRSSGVRIWIDEKHLVIPERPGNRRFDSLRNILSNPNIGMIFLIPGLEETLRINGKACITNDEPLLEQMTVHGKKPLLGIGVKVEECYIHCAIAFRRSELWNAGSWPKKESLPAESKILADHVNMPGITAEEVAKSLKETYEKRLY